MVQRLVAVFALALVAGCQRNLDMPPVPDTVPLSLDPAFVPVAPREATVFAGVGGAPPYAYAFAQGGKLSGANATIDAATGAYVAGGNGSAVDLVEVTDSKGAKATASASVGPRLAIAPLSPSTTPGGRVTFSASGGKQPYAFALATAASGTGAGVGATTGVYTAGSTGDVKDVAAVTDAAGVAVSTEVSVGPALRIYRAETTAVAPLGSVALVALGGKPPYTFSIQSAASGTGAGINATTGVYTAGGRPLPDAGTGNVTDVVQVTDSADVPKTASLAIPVGERPRTLVPTFATAAPREEVTFTAGGGSGGYTFAFAPGGQNSGADATIDAATGLYRAGSSGSALDVVQVTDGMGRGATATVSVGARVAIAPLSPSTTPGGRVTFSASGGKGPYGFAFEAGGNCSGGTTASDGTYTAGSAGDCKDRVVVTDFAGGTATTTVNVSTALRIYRPDSTPVAPLASATLVALGGKPPYTFAIQSSASGTGAGVNATTGVYTAGGRPLPDTGIGLVTDVLKVTDSADVPQEATLSVAIGERPRTLTPATSSIAPREQLTFALQGAAGTVTYAFAASGRVSGADATIDASTGLYQAGSGGSATDVLQATDGYGRTATATVVVGPRVAISPLSPSAAPGGRITFTASAGKGSYSFSFAPGGNLSGGTVTVGGLYTAGSIGGVGDVVQVTDGAGGTATTTVNVGAALQIYRGDTATLAPRESVTFIAFGGKGPYTFSLDSAGSGADATINPVSGVYTAGSGGSATDVVRVTDLSDVRQSVTASVLVGPRLQLSMPARTPHPGETVQLTATGGRAPYAFAFAAWSPFLPGNRDPNRTSGGNGGNRSGGSVESATGLYRPGPSPGATDFLQVTDATGSTAVILGQRIGGRQLDIGGSTKECTAINLDGDLSNDVAFIGRTDSQSYEVTKVVTGQFLGSSDPLLRTYFLAGWPREVGSYAVLDSGFAARDQLLVIGGNSGTGGSNYDAWKLSPDLQGALSVANVPFGTPSQSGAGRGAGYWDDSVSPPTWRLVSDAVEVAGSAGYDCPSVFTADKDAYVTRFDWAQNSSYMGAQHCYRVQQACSFCGPTVHRGFAAMALGDFTGDGNLDLAWITDTSGNAKGASGVNAKVSVAAGVTASNTFALPDSGWPPGATFELYWGEPTAPRFFTARRPTGSPLQKDAVIVRLIDPTTARPLLYVFRTPTTLNTAVGFDPNPSGAGVDGIAALAGNDKVSGTSTTFMAWSGSDGAVASFDLDWTYDPPRFVSKSQLATYPFAVSGACFADVNADRIPDLVAASDWGATAGIELGDGSNSAVTTGATYGTRTHLQGMVWPVAVGDFDGDGYLDAVEGVAGKGLTVLWGGGGQFAWGDTLTAASTGYAVAGDFTGDGRTSVLFQEKSGKWGRVTFTGGGTSGFTLSDPPPTGTNAAGNGPTGSYFIGWPADLGTPGTPGSDMITFSIGEGGTIVALLHQRYSTGPATWGYRIVEAKASAFAPPASHSLRDEWALGLGVDQPLVAAITSYRQDSTGNRDAVAIYTAPISNPEGAPGTVNQPAFGGWALRAPATLNVGTTAIWSPPGVTTASVSAAGTVKAGLSVPLAGRAVFVFYTDKLYVAEVVPGAVPTVTTHVVTFAPGVSSAPVLPFLGTMGRLEAPSAGYDFHVVLAGDDGMTVLRRTGGTTSPAWQVVQRLGVPYFPLGIGPLNYIAPAGPVSPGDVVGYQGDFGGTGIAPEVIPMLNDGLGKLMY